MPRKKTPRTVVLNTKEAAIYVGLSASALEKMRVYGEDGPPFATLMSAIRYRVTDLDAWLASRLSRSVRERKRASRGRGDTKRD